MRPKHNRLITDALREISKTRSRFLSLLLLSALAVAFLSGLRTTAPVMERTADGYYDHHNLMDLHVLSTLGLTDDDIDYLASLEDISAAEGCYTADGILHLESNDLVVKLVSLSEQGINTPELVEGRMPEANDECLVEPLLLEQSGLSIGDKISFDTGTGDYADALAVEEFTIVGTANSPLYLSTDRGTSSLGTGRVNGFVLLLPGAFDMETYTDAYLTVSWAKDLYCYDDAYGDRMDALVEALEPLGDERAALRYDEVIGEANQALSDAQKEFDDAEAEANQELADARQELDDGWAEYYDGLETYETESADAWQQIADAEADLPEALKELEDGEKEYADGVQELTDGKAKYWDGLKEWQDGKAEYDQGYQDLLDGEAEYSENYKTLSDAQQEYDEGWQEYQDGLVALEDGGGQLMAAEAELDAARRALESGAAQISAGQAQLEAGRAALSKAKEDLNTQLGTLAQVLPVFSPGTALTSAEAILSPETPWTAADGQAIVTLLNLAGGSGALTGQFQDMVDQGLMTQEQADGLIAQLDAPLAAAAGGTDSAGAPVPPHPAPRPPFAAPAASDFLDGQKVTKEPPGGGRNRQKRLRRSCLHVARPLEPPLRGTRTCEVEQNFRRAKSERFFAVPSGPLGPGFAKNAAAAAPQPRLALPNQRLRCGFRRRGGCPHPPARWNMDCGPRGTLIRHGFAVPPTPFVPSGHFPLIGGIVLPPRGKAGEARVAKCEKESRRPAGRFPAGRQARINPQRKTTPPRCIQTPWRCPWPASGRGYTSRSPGFRWSPAGPPPFGPAPPGSAYPAPGTPGSLWSGSCDLLHLLPLQPAVVQAEEHQSHGEAGGQSRPHRVALRVQDKEHQHEGGQGDALNEIGGGGRAAQSVQEQLVGIHPKIPEKGQETQKTDEVDLSGGKVQQGRQGGEGQ